jgi:hypothetical protein
MRSASGTHNGVFVNVDRSETKMNDERAEHLDRLSTPYVFLMPKLRRPAIP